MAKDNKKLVQAITSQEENFAQWYTDMSMLRSKWDHEILLPISQTTGCW